MFCAFAIRPSAVAGGIVFPRAPCTRSTYPERSVHAVPIWPLVTAAIAWSSFASSLLGLLTTLVED
jgi:hypothetical protein